MPALHYWLSGGAFWLAGSFVITVILGIIGVKEMIPSKVAVFLIGVAILVMFIGWWTTAEQEQKSAQVETENAKMRADISLIKQAMGIKPGSDTAEEITPKAIAETLDAQTIRIRDETLNNFSYFRLAEDQTDPKQVKLRLDASGPVFLINYWISHGSANRNAKDPAYWSADQRKPIVPVVYPGAKDIQRTLPIGDYIIEFDGLNGHWNEYLSITIQDGKPKQNIRITNAKGDSIFDSEKEALN